MSTATKAHAVSALDIDSRFDAYAWSSISGASRRPRQGDGQEAADASECAAIAGLYADRHRFCSHIVMARHGFGRREYKYFSYPLPGTVADLRTARYSRLAPIANRWNVSMGVDVRYPDVQADFIARCRKAGQKRPTPLLL